MSRTRQLDFEESRVLGALMEKEQTTPDAYPLTINALIAACNQKTSREPVTELSETEVVEALDRLRRDALAWRTEGARVERWEHLLDRRWILDRRRKAIMTLLLLRGPQTAAELKTRSDRLASFASRDEVESLLGEMAAEVDPLVQELPRQPGQRETRWRHLMGLEGGVEGVATGAAEASAGSAPASPPRPAAVPPADGRPPTMAGDRLARVEEALDELRRTLFELQGEVKELRRRLGDLE